MKKNFRKILCILLVALLAAAVLAGCDPDPKGAVFCVEITSAAGVPIAGVTVDVSLDGSSVARGQTGADGKFSFEGESARYVVQISDLPSNFTLTNDGRFTFDASEDNDVLKLSFVDANDYNFTLQSVGGAKLEGVKVALLKDGQVAGESVTGTNGVASFALPAADYEYRVEDLPYGYYFADPADATGRTGEEKKFRLEFPSQVTSEPRSDRTYRAGDIFFNFEIEDASEGRAYKLSDLLAEKKMVLINFWNTGCGPCVSEMPGLDIAYAQYKSEAEVLAISSILSGWDSAAAVKKFKEDYQLSFPMFADGPYEELGQVHFAQYILLSALPTTLVIDRYGMIAAAVQGGMGTDQFLRLFERYTADDYRQDTLAGGDDDEDEQPERERLEPDVSQEESSVIEAAINGDGFEGEWYPETSTDDAKYSWPWAVETLSEGGQSVQAIKPTNHFIDYSFATIKTKVFVSEEDVENGGKVALVFDLKYSTEQWGDYLYVVVNSEIVYSYTGTEHWEEWQRCYALIADEPGEYELTLLFNKDEQNAGGQDTVCVKNVRMITRAQVDGETTSLDMPRAAARDFDQSTKKFAKYAPTTLAEDGFYHYMSEDGPYVLADLFALTQYQRMRGEQRNVSEAATAGIGIFRPEQGEEISATARAITPYLQAANNSELSGLTVVDAKLRELLNAYAKDAHPECDDNAWLEFCTWFEHFGTDASDKGISTFERNPVRGLMQATAIPMAEPHSGMFDDLANIENVYKNHVTIDRVIMPRGLIYSITPSRSGAYRFRSQSARLGDTTAWLRAEDMDVNSVLTEFGEEREDPDADFNFVITWYLQQDKTYFLSVGFADVAGTGEFTFTTEYLGERFFSWQAVSRAVVTFEEGENGEMGALKNYFNAYPVLANDGYYYDAERNADGSPKTDGQGNLIPDLNDPIYVDFLNGSRFMEQSLETVIEMKESNNILKRLREEILPNVFSNVSTSVGNSTSLTRLNGGSPLSEETWQRLAAAITSSYGDAVSFSDGTYAALRGCAKVGDILRLLQDNFLNAFDFSDWRGRYIARQDASGAPMVDENGNVIAIPMWQYLGVSGDEDLKNYTSDIGAFLAEARAKTQADHAEAEYGGFGFDAGCLKLSEKLCTILKLFAQRYGWLGLNTDWMRLCYHYEYIGPYEG